MTRFQNDYDQDMSNKEAQDPIVLSDYLPWYYRLVIWVSNHLIFYSISITTLGAVGGYYLSRIAGW